MFGLPDYVRYIEDFVTCISRFYSIHFTITLAGTQDIVRYIEDFVKQKFVKSRFHCIVVSGKFFSFGDIVVFALKFLPYCGVQNLLTLETSAFESLYGGQFAISTQLIKPNYLVIQKVYMTNGILQLTILKLKSDTNILLINQNNCVANAPDEEQQPLLCKLNNRPSTFLESLICKSCRTHNIEPVAEETLQNKQ